MTKDKKLSILNELIERASQITYATRSDMREVKDNANSFIRNVLERDSEWLARIDKIRWNPVIFTSSTPDCAFAEAWDSGKSNFIGVLNSIKTEIELYSEQTTVENAKSKTKSPTSNKVFIVHGHDETMKLALVRVVTQLELSPVILHEQPNKGRTIIEKFERLSADVSFAIVLLSADDLLANGKYRSRQNVIFELGYFCAKLGRENVVALYNISDKNIEVPSDISGILYKPYDKADGQWRFEIVQELQAAGFNVNANSLLAS